MKLLGKEIDLPAERVTKLTKNQKAAVLGGTLLLLTAVYVSLFYLPQSRKCAQLAKEVAATSQELTTVKTAAGGLQNFRVQMADSQEKFREALTLLPNTKEIPGLLSAISRAGNQSGLEFKLFKPNLEVPKQFYADIPVEVKVVGTYHDIARFFDAVSKLSRIVNISELKMSDPKETSNGTVAVTAQCLATTYKFIENPTPEPKDAKAKQPKKKA